MADVIACLGWGSLVWNPDGLPLKTPWHKDGPTLPVEFARQSNNGRITLVTCAGAPPVPVLWAEMDAANKTAAIDALAAREGIPAKNIERHVGVWRPDEKPLGPIADTVGEWAAPLGLAAVVWTALPPKFGGVERKPSVQEVVDYLSGLTGERRILAEEYIRRTPRQVRTRYRTAIEHSLGWQPDEDGPGAGNEPREGSL